MSTIEVCTEEERMKRQVDQSSGDMSTSTPSTILAAVCVVDSSLALAVEWPKVLSDYLTPIIQRLAELTCNVNQVMSHSSF